MEPSSRTTASAKPGLQIFKDHGYNWIRLRLFHTPTAPAEQSRLHDRAGEAGAELGLQIPSRLIITPTPGPIPASNSSPRRGRASRTRSLCERSSTIPATRSRRFARRACCPTWCRSATRSSTACSGPTASCPSTGTSFAELVEGRDPGCRCRPRIDGPRPRIMIHIDRGGDKRGTKAFFDKLHSYDVKYDVIGQSYYPWWHGSLLDLRENLDFMASRVPTRTSCSWRWPIAGGPPNTEEAGFRDPGQRVLTRSTDRLTPHRASGIRESRPCRSEGIQQHNANLGSRSGSGGRAVRIRTGEEAVDRDLSKRPRADVGSRTCIPAPSPSTAPRGHTPWRAAARTCGLTGTHSISSGNGHRETSR